MSVQTISTPCAVTTCDGGNMSAVFVALCEDASGAPTAVLPACGPCAAALAYDGFIVKVRPFNLSDDGRRLAWPE